MNGKKAKALNKAAREIAWQEIRGYLYRYWSWSFKERVKIATRIVLKR